MKIAVCGDVHWSQYSSILRKNGEKYSSRLENLILTINWFNNLAEMNNCSYSVFLGDFFDKPELNAKEISALKEIKWNNVKNYFICGNHEMGQAEHLYTSADIFKLLPDFQVVPTPTSIDIGNVELCFLPYILEENRKCIKEYFPNNKNKIIFSHNDIKGIQMGQFISKEGFDINDIEENCALFLNGHLHNGGRISPKIINVGNCTGQNFSENAFKYDHCVFILDTDTMKIAVYENPFAFNFYSIDVTDGNINILNTLKQNSIVTIKCTNEQLQKVNELLSVNGNIIEHRTIIQQVVNEIQEDKIEEILTINHLDEFRKFIIDTYGDNDIVKKELSIICGVS